MLVNAVIYTFAPQRADEVATMLIELAAASRNEAGCLRFDVSRSNDDPATFVLFEQWRDRAALDAHYATDHFVKLGANGIRPLALSRIAHLCTPLLG